ncbi:hypothetical protein GOBAR_DD12102 [Gossypium barbadense]|nr:hypothetical protein GOBAR_DD12102 [Gossypium barbadense]
MAGKTVIISNQPYFYKKAELFPGSAFVIGADTAVRLINFRKQGKEVNGIKVLQVETAARAGAAIRCCLINAAKVSDVVNSGIFCGASESAANTFSGV